MYIQLAKEIILNAIYQPGPHLTEGREWPPGDALTMIGRKRLDNLEQLTCTVLEEGVTGDLIETGVWRGGATILMRAILQAYDVSDRRVFVADSFCGIPPINLEKYPADRAHEGMDKLEILTNNSLESVRENFRRMHLLDEQVVFVEGWFKDSLPQIATERLALLRLDGDLYESTMDALTHLYPKLSQGGFVIVDDMCLEGCVQAVEDYRQAHHITDPMTTIDWTGIYWQKASRMDARHKKEADELKGGLEELRAHLAQTETRHKAQVEELTGHFNREIEQLRERILTVNELLRKGSVSLAESEGRGEKLGNRLRQQLKATQRLSRLLDEADEAAARLRSSGRWQIANPVAALKAKLSPQKSRHLLGYGHLEKIVSAYQKWRTTHPEVTAIDDQIQALVSGAASAPAQRRAPVEPPAPTRPIEFPLHEQVEISIIIPVFNQFHFTQACLASLQEHQGTERFEVIVVDDCSTDQTAEAIPQIPGVVYLRNEKNSGFIASCNRGTETARGKYLVFLNNDTLAKPGWLSALLDTFAEEPQAGIVGSKLIYPDGRLQEAGGIIWQDASGWNYGKFDDPEKPEYNYLREVDYCSAAALMIPKSLFASVGGFDSRYAPAYYEDTDLAFKVRKAGYKILYQPLSEVIHYEGATGGTDLATGTKKHQDINRSTFAETWANELMARPVNGDVAFLRQPPPDRKNILVIDYHLPMPDKDAGSVRMFHILNILHQLGHRVTFIPGNLASIPPYTDELQKRGIEVIYHPYVKKVRDYLIAHGSSFDAVVLSRCDFARKHIADVRIFAPQSRIIFDTVDLHFLREESEAHLTGDPEIQRSAQETQQLEHELIDQTDETWVVSSVEQKLLREARPDKSIEIVSTIAAVPGSKTPFARRRDWLFIGGFQHTPNVDAVLFFVHKIYPLVSEHLPDAKFYIIGDKAPPEIVALATERIIVAGWQRDIRPFFDSAKLSVAPLRFGAGIKGKINQSMGFGVPVVATTLAVEGMPLINRKDILVADEPEDFAQALIELYESEELWKRVSENGIRKTRALYSTEAAREKLKLLFSDEHLKVLGTSPPVAERELLVTDAP
jgi:GT2 family glycosyltransferase